MGLYTSRRYTLGTHSCKYPASTRQLSHIVFNGVVVWLWRPQGTGGAFYPEGWQKNQPAWSRVRHIKYGYGRMTAYNATDLSYEFRPLSKKAADADIFWIKRSAPPE